MARDYKLFKTLEIDGVKMGLDENLGQDTYVSEPKAISTANTWINGASTTITEPGSYYMQARWTFPSSTSTGEKENAIALGVKKNGQSSFATISEEYSTKKSNVAERKACSSIMTFSSTDVPAELVARGFSTMTSAAGNTGLLVAKIVNTVMGG